MKRSGAKSTRLERLRMDYLRGSLDESTMSKSPNLQLSRWIDVAIKQKLIEPHAMTLATVDGRRRPHARVVLLRGIQSKGLVFFTNYESAKGKHLSSNPFGALVFYWSELERQVRIEGKVSQLSAAASNRYFASRPRANQIGAWASKQSEPVASRAALDTAFAEAVRRFQGKQVPRPSNWGGYILTPSRFEFWQGQKGRLHDRVEYMIAKSGKWRIQRLYP